MAGSPIRPIGSEYPVTTQLQCTAIQDAPHFFNARVRRLVFSLPVDEGPLALRDAASSQPIIISVPELASAHPAAAGVDAQSRGFEFRCRARAAEAPSCRIFAQSFC